MNESNKTLFAKALANYLHREIIEDAHCKYNISQHDMEIMNRRSVNRAKFFIDILGDEEQLGVFIVIYSLNVFKTWDDPEQTEETTEIAKMIKDISENGNYYFNC